jgi:hypothetical protein
MDATDDFMILYVVRMGMRCKFGSLPGLFLLGTASKMRLRPANGWPSTPRTPNRRKRLTVRPETLALSIDIGQALPRWIHGQPIDPPPTGSAGTLSGAQVASPAICASAFSSPHWLALGDPAPQHDAGRLSDADRSSIPRARGPLSHWSRVPISAAPIV